MRSRSSEKTQEAPSYEGRGQPKYMDVTAESVSSKPGDRSTSPDVPAYIYAHPRYWEYR